LKAVKSLFLSSLSYILHHPDFYIIFLARMLNFKTLTFLFHLLDQILSADQLKVTDSLILVSMLRAIFWIYILPGVNFNLKLVITALQSAVHDKGNYLCVVMLESLIFNIYILRLCPLSYTISVLAVFGTIFGNMDAEKDLAASGVLAFLFPKFLTAPRFR
jgi:hypothetical protein